MNKKLAAAALLALPLVSLTGPAFAFDLTPVETPTTPAPIEEVVKSKAQLKAEEKIAKTESKTAEKIAKTTEQAQNKVGTPAAEKTAAKTAEKIAKTTEQAQVKNAKTQAQADAQDTKVEVKSAAAENRAVVKAAKAEEKKVEPKEVTFSFVDTETGDLIKFAEGDSPVLTVVNGDTKTVIEDVDGNGVYGDEEGSSILVGPDTEVTVDLSDDSLLKLIGYSIGDDEDRTAVPLDEVLSFDFASLDEDENSVKVFAEVPQMSETLAQVVTAEKAPVVTEQAPVVTAEAEAPVAEAEIPAPAAAEKAPVAEEEAAPAEGAVLSAAAMIPMADESETEYDLMVEPVDGGQSNLEGGTVKEDDLAPMPSDDVVVEETVNATDAAINTGEIPDMKPSDGGATILENCTEYAAVDVYDIQVGDPRYNADKDTDGDGIYCESGGGDVLAAEKAPALLADTGASLAMAGFAGLLVVSGGLVAYGNKRAKPVKVNS